MTVPPAPAWLSYASPAVAALAFLLALATYRRAGPQVTARIQVSSGTAEDGFGSDLLITLRLANKGLAPVDIEALYIGLSAFSAAIRIGEIMNIDMVNGEQLPYRLEGTSVRTWVWSYRRSIRRMLTSGNMEPRVGYLWPSGLPLLSWPITAYIAVALATGERHARFGPVGTFKLIKEFKKMAKGQQAPQQAVIDTDDKKPPARGTSN